MDSHRGYGIIDKEGVLFLQGRIKRMIMTVIDGFLDKLPLTSAGKIDYQKLQE